MEGSAVNDGTAAAVVTVAELLCGNNVVMEVEDATSASSLLPVCPVGGITRYLDLSIRDVVL